MKTTTRLYMVSNKRTHEVRLVEAVNQAQALRFIAQDEYAVMTPTAVEAVTLIGSGVKHERAVAQPVDDETPPTGEAEEGASAK